MNSILKVVLDVMKPYTPNIVEYAVKLTELTSVESVNIALLETDREVENIKITMEGKAIDYVEIEEAIQDLGGAIHSIDLVVAGKDMIETAPTPQDTG